MSRYQNPDIVSSKNPLLCAFFPTQGTTILKKGTCNNLPIRQFPSGLQSFRINGTVHHRMGALLPPPGMPHSCAQLYVLDTQAQVNARTQLRWGDRLRADVLRQLTEMLQDVNPYVQVIERASDIHDPSVASFS